MQLKSWNQGEQTGRCEKDLVQAGEEASSTEATQKMTYVMRDLGAFCSQTAGEDPGDVLSWLLCPDRVTLGWGSVWVVPLLPKCNRQSVIMELLSRCDTFKTKLKVTIQNTRATGKQYLELSTVVMRIHWVAFDIWDISVAILFAPRNESVFFLKSCMFQFISHLFKMTIPSSSD